MRSSSRLVRSLLYCDVDCLKLWSSHVAKNTGFSSFYNPRLYSMSTDYQGSPNSSSSQGIMVNPVEAQQIRTANSREAKEEGLDASKFLIEDSLSTTKKIESWHDSNHESTPESDSNLPSESNLIRAMGLQTSHHSSQNYEVDGSAPQLVGPPQSNRESVIAESELATASQQDESDNHVRNEVQNGDDPVLIYLKKLSGHSRLENTDQAKDLLQLIKSNSHTDARLGVLELIQRTDSRDILDSVANSQKFCSCCSKWMNSALEDQSWLLLENMLKTLMHLPMQLKKVRKYNLGIAVRRTKDKAKVNDKVEVQQLADKLIETWKDMQAEASQDASAGTSAKEGDSSKKSIKLALQKDPPARAKAITNKDFFTSLTSSAKPKSSYIIRPSSSSSNNLSIDRILEQWKKPSSGPAASLAQSSSMERDYNENNKVAMPRLKKRVRFEPDHKLVQIREYERDPDEWKSHALQPMANWRVPCLIALAPENRKHKQVDTYEVQVQRVREMRTPPVVYPTKMQIPFSPAEPSVLEESDPNVTKIIPLHDTTLHDEAMGVQDSLDQVPYSPQAITYSPPEPEKIALQPTWTQVEPAPVSSMQLPASEPAAPVSGTDVSPSIAQVSQMLINNPEIMQMAMQMLKTQQPIVTHEPAPTLPPPLPPASALPPRQNSDRHHPNRQWNAPSGDNYGNSSGGGAIRMHGESRNIDHQHLPYSRQNKHKPYGRKKGKALCRFYTTSQGCRSGDDCPFLHDRN